MQNARSLFQQSIEQYQAILDAVHALAPEIESGLPERLRQSVAKLENLQEEAARTDSLLNESLPATEPDSGLLELLERRQKLMQELGRMNRLLVAQLEGRMSLLASEMRQGRQVSRALSGYRFTDRTRGSMLAERF